MTSSWTRFQSVDYLSSLNCATTNQNTGKATHKYDVINVYKQINKSYNFDFVCLPFQIDTAILGSTLKEAVVKIFENMEMKHITRLVTRIFAYITASKENTTIYRYLLHVI